MNITLLGDSQLQGLRPHLVPGLERLGATVVRTTANQGWGTVRYIASGLLSSSTELLGGAGADLAIIELGGNDRFSDEDEDAYASILARARAQIRAKHVLWVGPAHATDPTIYLAHESVARLQRTLVPRLPSTSWFDSRPYTRDEQRDDGVHFTVDGYARWSRHIVDAVAWLTLSPVVRAMYLGSFGLFSGLRSL